MIYKDFKGIQLSQLGMGNMRLPTEGGPTGKIDMEKAQKIIDYVYENGVNYFDTAYLYHGGESEKFLGQALKKYPRDSYYLADKMPGMMMGQPGNSPKDIFEEQLKRCQTDYFDFYLLHGILENNLHTYLDEKLGIIDYLLEQKKAGRIRYLGFSSHARTATLKSFLDRFDFFDFAQIQLNYLDWSLQDAKGQYELLTERGIPVIVMEPCRGGRLASLGEEADGILLKAAPGASVASWAFRYLQGLPNVQVVLSGMTQLEQAEDNIKTFSKPNPLTDEEKKALDKVIDILKGNLNVPCTACHYCDGCPVELDIPGLITMYNESCVDFGFLLMAKINSLPEDKKPSACIACGRCAEKCPQSIDIPEVMKKFKDKLASMPQMPPMRR